MPHIGSPVLPRRVGQVEALVRRRLPRLAGRPAEPAAPRARLVARPAPQGAVPPRDRHLGARRPARARGAAWADAPRLCARGRTGVEADPAEEPHQGGHRPDRPLHVRARRAGRRARAGGRTRPADRLDHRHRVALAPQRVALPGGEAQREEPDPGEPARPGRQDRAVFATHYPRSSGRSASTGRRLRAWRTKDGSAVFPPGGAPLDPSRLSGLVDVRAHILDRQSFRGWFRDVPLLETDHHPARVHLHVDRAD